MAINKITDEKINKLRKKSAKALPDKPSERGYTADQLKNAFSGFVVDDENSVIEEINKLIDSINAEFNKLVGTSDSNGTIIDKISKTFQSQNPILSLNSDSNGKLKYTTYNNRHNVEIDIVPSNTVISSQNDLCTLDGKVVLDKKALLNRISTLEENYNALTENAPETLDTITEIAAALKNNSNIIDTLVVKENGKGLSTNDFTNAHKEKLDNLNGLMVTESEKNIWNSKSDFSGSYDDLIDKPNLDAYVKNIPGAFDYENLNNIPEIPSIVGLASEEFVNQKINDLIGSAPENLNTLKELADMLTNQQSTIGNINQILSSKASVTHTHTKSDITNFPDIYYKLEQMIETDNSKHFTKAEKEKVATIDNKLNSNLGSNESNKILITDENGDIKTALAGSTTLLEDSLESTSVITAPTANQVRILNNIKLDINQSTNNAGKYMKVGTDGNLIPFDIEQEYKKFTTDSISNLPTKEYINNNYLPLTGGILTDELYMHRSGSVDTMMKFKRTDIGTELFVGIGEGGTNHGLYSKTLNKWMVYADANNVTLNGNAQTATKAVQDSDGNVIKNIYTNKTELQNGTFIVQRANELAAKAVVGSNKPNSAGWYKFAEETLSGWGDRDFIFAISGTYNHASLVSPTPSGIVKVHIRSNDTSICINNIDWLSRVKPFRPEYIIGVVDGMKYSLYVYQENQQYGKINIQALSFVDSAANTLNPANILMNNDTKEATAPTATKTGTDAGISGYALQDGAGNNIFTTYARKTDVPKIIGPITQAEYDALTPDANTIYLIKEE